VFRILRKSRSQYAFQPLTVLEVTGLDRPGLLMIDGDFVQALPEYRLGPYLTFGEKADVFYVTDFTGEKITSAHKQEAYGGRS